MNIKFFENKFYISVIQTYFWAINVYYSKNVATFENILPTSYLKLWKVSLFSSLFFIDFFFFKSLQEGNYGICPYVSPWWSFSLSNKWICFLQNLLSKVIENIMKIVKKKLRAFPRDVESWQIERGYFYSLT